MNMIITDPVGAANRIQVTLTGLGSTEVSYDHADEALHELARILDYTLVDSKEREGLLELVEEAEDDDNDYDLASTAWGAWQDRCEALASAVRNALTTDTEA